MQTLVKNMQNMEVDQQQPQRAVKRSLVEVFLEEERKQNKKSTNIARLELARAENRKEKITQNLQKIKQRAKTYRKIWENRRPLSTRLVRIFHGWGVSYRNKLQPSLPPRLFSEPPLVAHDCWCVWSYYSHPAVCVPSGVMTRHLGKPLHIHGMVCRT